MIAVECCLILSLKVFWGQQPHSSVYLFAEALFSEIRAREGRRYSSNRAMVR